MRRFLSTATRTLIGLTAVTGALQAQGTGKLLPLKYAGPPTVADITAGDLMTRLYKFADDSMMGRSVGTEYHLKAAAYIEAELRKMGLKPGGTNGSFYQDFPIWEIRLERTSSITSGGKSFTVGRDLLFLPGSGRSVSNLPLLYYGSLGDTTGPVMDSAAVAGKVVMFLPFPTGVTPDARAAAIASKAYQGFLRARPYAAASIQILGDSISTAMLSSFTQPSVTIVEPAGIATALVSTAAGEALLGTPFASAKRGQAGTAPVSIDLRFSRTAQTPGRNVVAILPGTDPVLKNQYVAIGAHSDHVGFTPMPVAREHDSLVVFNKVGRPAGAEGGRSLLTSPITAEEWTKINADIAELRKTYPPRPDSIANGADDDGSGSMSVLELAEKFAKGMVKPKRSILFVWHAGEERGMWGSGYFMDNPTVPRDSIVAQINIDMVGRGAASDITGQTKGPVNPTTGLVGAGEPIRGGDRYVQLVGSRRLSTELGDLVEKVNTEKKHGFTLDYNIDADGHQQNIYCRSDHWSYGKWGVPVVFFTTGGHADYHQVTDEPQYIRYDHMAALDNLIFDIAVATANLPKRPLVDKPKPDPKAACRQ